MVRVLAFYLDDKSLNHTQVYNFNLLENKENYRNRQTNVHRAILKTTNELEPFCEYLKLWKSWHSASKYLSNFSTIDYLLPGYDQFLSQVDCESCLVLQVLNSLILNVHCDVIADLLLERLRRGHDAVVAIDVEKF